MTNLRLNKTLLLSGKKETFDGADVLAVNRDLDNVFIALQDLDRRPRTVSDDPQDATASDRAKAGYLGEIVYYSTDPDRLNGDLYFCTNKDTPTWKKITAT